jgi:hypothetical protein
MISIIRRARSDAARGRGEAVQRIDSLHFVRAVTLCEIPCTSSVRSCVDRQFRNPAPEANTEQRQVLEADMGERQALEPDAGRDQLWWIIHH